MATKAREAFRTISEVANWLDTPAHVLRFWESKFSQIKPVKRAGGRRYYRPSDMELIGGIKKLLHDDGMTIRGVQKMLKEEGVKKVAALSPPIENISDQEAAERRAARRARRAARRAGKQAPDKQQIEEAQITQPEADVVPLTTAEPEDNVVQLTRREQRRARLEEQAAELDKVQDDTPELDFGTPAPEAEPSAPAPAPPQEQAEAAAPEVVEDETPLEEADTSEAEPVLDDQAPAEETAQEATEAAAEPETKQEVPDAPESEDIEISETKIATFNTTKTLRQIDALDPEARERAHALYERLVALRDRIAEDADQV